MYFQQLLAKIVSKIARTLGRGGETWPGEIALRLDRNLSQRLRQRFARVILVAGTNGKTSTAKFLAEVLSKAGESVVQNRTGANLLNGLVSTALVQLSLVASSQRPVAVLEVDEYALPEIMHFFKPEAILFLNVFRDQLDRYGEVNNILNRWNKALLQKNQAKLFYLASDPSLYYSFESLSNPRFPFTIPTELLTTKPSGVLGDLVYCPVCQTKLAYRGYYLGHLGDWECPTCQRTNPKGAVFKAKEREKLKNLPSYMQINLSGAFLLLKELGISEELFFEVLKAWQPAFGRGEEILRNGCQYTFYLGKNPASWTAALGHINTQATKNAILVLGLNNRVPDGHDVSWIYDAEFQIDPRSYTRIFYFGDRAYDLAQRLRLKGIVSGRVFTTLTELLAALEGKGNDVTILANYSALLEIRKLLTGKALI